MLAGANDLAPINEDATGNAGTLVSALIAGQVSDADPASARGIAVVGADNANGAWQYSLNGGSSWAAIGSPGTGSALLLASDANTRVRFVPNGDWNGGVAGGLRFHAWDQTAGTNGATASVLSSRTMRDEFTSGGYGDNHGSADWSNAWSTRTARRMPGASASTVGSRAVRSTTRRTRPTAKPT